MAKNLTAESLNLLLVKLSPDERESAAVYQTLRASLVRFFELKGDFEPESAADETLDRMALKIADGILIEDIKKYSFGVARLIYLERMRLSHKQKNAAQEFSKANDHLKGDLESAESDFFRDCFNSLNVAEREFLQSYFTDLPYGRLIELRRRLTVETGISLEQMRVKVFRLRKRLEICVQQKRKDI